MDRKDISFRFDLITEILTIDEQSNTLTFRVKPDPRRYEWKETENGRLLYDKLDNIYFLEKMVYELLEYAIKSEPTHQPQLLGNSTDYVIKRKNIISNFFKSRKIPCDFRDKSDQFLKSLEIDHLNFVIVSLDIVNSTKLSEKLSTKDYSFIISLILFELSEIIPKFHGYILKYTGDGFIAYFPEPSFITKNDLALDCSVTLQRIIKYALNPVLTDNNFPNIEIRIGLDAGEAFVTIIGSPQSKQHKDIIGSIVNMACKIQSVGKPGDILMGKTVEQNLYVLWRNKCEQIQVPNNWYFKNKNGDPYMIYRLNLKN